MKIGTLDKSEYLTLPDSQKIAIHRERAIANAPVSMRAPYELAYAGKSRAAAIKAMCLRCSNNQRAEITFCRVFDCPLREFRPYQHGDDDAGEPS